ncbi:MAG TPA: PDZ domain-containing protein [Pirellulaceae bacterium]|nr:PDZ domain-containing protein [Pirellulaceae bacterium]
MHAVSNLTRGTMPTLASILALLMLFPLGARGQEDRTESSRQTPDVDSEDATRESDPRREERSRPRPATRGEERDDGGDRFERTRENSVDDADFQRRESTRGRAGSLRREEVEDRPDDEGRETDAREPAGAARGRESSATRRRSDGERSASTGGSNVSAFKSPDLGIWFQRGMGDLLIIDTLSRSGAIAQSGFLEGDRIVSVNGQRATSERQFLNLLLNDEHRGNRVPIVVIRDSRRQLIYVRPELLVGDVSAEVIDPLDRLGVVLDDRDIERMVVWRILPRSPAYYAGIRPGDVIAAFDGVEVVDAGDFVRQIEAADAEDIAVVVRRNQRDVDLVVDLRAAPIVAKQVLPPAVPRNTALDDLRPDPYSDRRLSPRPDVPPGMRIPGGEVGRERGPITPATSGPTPTTPMRPGFPR